MTTLFLQAVDRRLPQGTRLALRKAAARVRYDVAAALGWRQVRAARRAVDAAFAAFEPRTGRRDEALRDTALRAILLRGHPSGGPELSDALLAAAQNAEMRFRPAGLQSYAEVWVRTAAIRVFAQWAAKGRRGGGNPEALLASLAVHAPADRAILLAHAQLLLDDARPAEAEGLVRRALRINAVCRTAQAMLARTANGVDYDLSDKFCPMPFTHLSTSYKADAFVCSCSAWLPYPVGNVTQAESAEEVWNSEAAQEIRRSIHDGDFRYCSRTLCSFIAARTLPSKADVEDAALRECIDNRSLVMSRSPDMLQLNHDPSCNLACPSCRKSVITAGRAEQRVYLDAAERVVLPLLRGMNGQTYITGGGEAFASAHYKKILRTLNPREFPGLYVYLISNGQLLTAKRWTEFPDLPEMIGVLSVSIDAARAETYEQLRRPGKWSVLMENLEGVSRMRAEGKLRMFQINLVVQAANFREIPDFIALGLRLGADNVWLQRLTNYGAYTEATFEEIDVTSPLHPDHGELLALLRPWVNHPLVNMDMLLPLLPEVVQGGAVNPHLLGRPRDWPGSGHGEARRVEAIRAAVERGDESAGDRNDPVIRIVS